MQMKKKMKTTKRMSRKEVSRLKVGDFIKFRTWDRYGFYTVVRKIVSIDGMGIGVRFNGCNPFFLGHRLDVIIEKVSPK